MSTENPKAFKVGKLFPQKKTEGQKPRKPKTMKEFVKKVKKGT
jgi:hypothetical protein